MPRSMKYDKSVDFDAPARRKRQIDAMTTAQRNANTPLHPTGRRNENKAENQNLRKKALQKAMPKPSPSGQRAKYVA